MLIRDYEINPYFEEIKTILKSIPEPRLAHALQFVNNLKEVDKIIVGTTCIEDLEGIISNIKQKIMPIDYNRFIIKDEKYILPQNWKLE